MFPSNYQCDGQLNIWEYLGTIKTDPEPTKPICKHSGHSCNKEELYNVAHGDGIECPKNVCCRYCKFPFCGARCNGSEEPGIKPDDSICEGCKWRETEGRELSVDWHGQTWVYKCPGTACANWKRGTPLNLTAEAESIAMPEYDFQERTNFPYCYNRDFLPSLDKVIEIIEDHFGIGFEEKPCEWDESIERVFTKKKGKGIFEVYESHYAESVNNGVRHISASYDEPMWGRGRACDNLHEIMRFFEVMTEANKQSKKRKNNG